MQLSATQYKEVCMEAWLSCEQLLQHLPYKEISVSKRTKEIVDECAQICLITLEALKKKMHNMKPFAFLCIGICEECAEICSVYQDENFHHCASACKRCSQKITSLISQLN